MDFSPEDFQYMEKALRLAEQGLYTAAPNPRVGCVLVKEGKIIGQGYHQRTGEAHAEIHALKEAGEAAKGATAYVTLEPCAHYGKTPPCADALIAAKVSRVIAAMTDPNPQVAGQGIARLKAAGITARTGLMEDKAQELNPGFIARMTQGRPWVRLKAAASLDGKTALYNGESQWITGLEARQDAHCWRARSCAILAGIGTVKSDNPQLNVRGVATKRPPLKIILDSRLELSPAARLFDDKTPVLVVSAIHDPKKAGPIMDKGAQWLCLPGTKGKVDLPALMQELGKRGINELHSESGAKLHGALLAANLADELLLYLSPCLLGDKAKGLFDLPELKHLEKRAPLNIQKIDRIGQDIRILARFQAK